MWKLQKFSLTLFSQQITIYLIWRIFFSVWENFAFFHTVHNMFKIERFINIWKVFREINLQIWFLTWLKKCLFLESSSWVRRNFTNFRNIQICINFEDISWDELMKEIISRNFSWKIVRMMKPNRALWSEVFQLRSEVITGHTAPVWARAMNQSGSRQCLLAY